MDAFHRCDKMQRAGKTDSAVAAEHSKDPVSGQGNTEKPYRGGIPLSSFRRFRSSPSGREPRQYSPHHRRPLHTLCKRAKYFADVGVSIA